MTTADYILAPVARIQEYLTDYGYEGKIDGLIGPKTLEAVDDALDIHFGWGRSGWKKWSTKRKLIAVQQVMFNDAGSEVGEIDGYIGPQTEFAFEEWQGIIRSRPVDEGSKNSERVSIESNAWPKESQMMSYYGKPGTHQVRLHLPYTMVLAWNTSQKVNSFFIHKKCHDSAKRVFERVNKHYGYREIQRLRLHLFGGCLNVRKKRGGSSWSTHAWGAAIDIDPAMNRLRWRAPKARLSKPVYDRWWEFWEEEGWVSLGRARNYDWMHVQAARIG